MKNDCNKIILIDIHSNYMLDFSKYRQIIFSCQYNNMNGSLVYSDIDTKPAQTTEEKQWKRGEGVLVDDVHAKKKGLVFRTTFHVTWQDHSALRAQIRLQKV